jgi:hypothetical protein
VALANMGEAVTAAAVIREVKGMGETEGRKPQLAAAAGMGSIGPV